MQPSEKILPIKELIRWQIITGIGLGVLSSFIIPELIGIKLGGHNGDSYGASVVIVETIILLTLAIIFQAN